MLIVDRQDYGKPFKDSYIVPSMWLALWSASTFLGQMLGAIVAGWLQDKKGRKPSLLLGSIISAAAIALCFTSYLAGDINIRRGLFLVGKTITGVALGILMSTTQTFISEITSADLRGPMLALLPINTLLGQLIGAGVVFGLSHATSRRPYLIALATQWPLAVLVFVVALVVPESPAYLVAQGRSDVALRSLAKLHTSRVDLVSKLEEVVRFVRHGEQHSDTHTYLDCFKKKHVRQTFIVLFAGVIPQLFGFSTLSQAGYFMQVIGMAPTLSLAVLFLCLLLGLIANILGIWSISKIGRRKLILASLSLSTLIWFAMGVAGFWSSPAVAW